MSLIKIKNKVIPKRWNPQKDLQQTSHSLKVGHHLQPLYSDIYSHNGGIRVVHSQIEQQIKNIQWLRIESNNKYSIARSNDKVSSNVKWTYTSPIAINEDHLRSAKSATSQYIQKQTSQTDEKSQPNTPTSKSNLLNSLQGDLKKKTINNLTDADTVQSKYLVSATPHQIFQESEIIFKGSRDVGKIVPMKLVYGDNELQVDKIEHENFQRKTFLWDIQMERIKKSNNHCVLVRINDSKAIFSCIYVKNAFCLQHISDYGLLNIHYKRKFDLHSIFLCQPYEYTLNQLYGYGKINMENIKIICQHLESAIDALCKQRYSFFEIQGIENNIFYIHGKFKILPFFYKGKIQPVKNNAAVKAQIQQYLVSLLDKWK